jgi:hypothetical protein
MYSADSGLESAVRKSYKRLWDKSILFPKKIERERERERVANDFLHKKNEIKMSKNDLKKLKISWNILVGSYPIQKNAQRISSVIGLLFGHYGGMMTHSILNREECLVKENLDLEREQLCQARFSDKCYGVVGEQREYFLKIISGLRKFKTGILSSSLYRKELKSVAAVLSPFGWGEVTYRDSEAIRNGACLIKPDCSHLTTWPDIYQDGVTYIAIDWRGEDLIEKTENLLNNQELQWNIKRAAFDLLKNAHDNIGNRVDYLLKQFDELGPN